MIDSREKQCEADPKGNILNWGAQSIFIPNLTLLISSCAVDHRIIDVLKLALTEVRRSWILRFVRLKFLSLNALRHGV